MNTKDVFIPICSKSVTQPMLLRGGNFQSKENE